MENAEGVGRGIMGGAVLAFAWTDLRIVGA
jgi:hypothetical protein